MDFCLNEAVQNTAARSNGGPSVRKSSLTRLCSKSYKTIRPPKTNIQKPKNIDPTFVFETHVNICDSERKNVYSWFVFALLVRTEPLPGFTNQRPVGKPISLRRTPEPTGCLCSRKDTYVHFFSWGKIFMQRIWGEKSTGRLFLTVIIMMIVRLPSFMHPRPVDCT